MGWVFDATFRPLYPQERDQVPRAGLDGYRKPRPYQDLILGPSSR